MNNGLNTSTGAKSIDNDPIIWSCGKWSGVRTTTATFITSHTNSIPVQLFYLYPPTRGASLPSGGQRKREECDAMYKQINTRDIPSMNREDIEATIRDTGDIDITAFGHTADESEAMNYE